MGEHGRKMSIVIFFFFNDTATTEICTLSLHDALPIYALRVAEHFGAAHRRVDRHRALLQSTQPLDDRAIAAQHRLPVRGRLRLDRKSHTSELQSRQYLVCRLLLEKKKYTHITSISLFP